MTIIRLPSGNYINLDAISYAQLDEQSQTIVIHFGGDRLMLRGQDAKALSNHLVEFCLLVH